MELPGKQLWDKWDLRVIILLSLSLQTFLVLFAPLRKRVSTNWLFMPLWSAYLLADWAANFAVGLISNSQGGSDSSAPDNDNDDLLAFWAPFLLVHLGGPDTITAFALEDNALWLRHMLGLIFQSMAALYILFQSLPNSLWLPTMLMFLSGIIKYSERTRALYLASLDRFRDSMLKEPDPGPNYAKLMDEYAAKKEAKLPTKIEMIREFNQQQPKRTARDFKEKPTNLDVVVEAHRFFNKFRGLIVDLIFDFRERNESRWIFLRREARLAFRVVEVELNFFYEVLYTKVVVINSKLGYFLRFVSFGSLVSAFVLFHMKDKNRFHNFDFEIAVTYVLFVGAVALDFIALFMLICSDWTAVAFKKSDGIKESVLRCMFKKLLNVERQRWPEGPREYKLHFCGFELPIGFLRRRWVEHVYTFNLLDYCLHPRSKVMEKIYEFIGLTDFFDKIRYVESEPFNIELENFIFDELLMKSELADDLESSKEICSAKGDWTLRAKSCTDLLPYTVEVNFDECLLLWHVATELCYNTEETSSDVGEGPNNAIPSKNLEANRSEKEYNYRKIAKLLSDYMMYLLVMQPTMMAAVAGIGQIRYRDTCAETKRFFRNRSLLKREKRNHSCRNIFVGKCCKGDITNESDEEAVPQDVSGGCCFCCKKSIHSEQDLKLACELIRSVKTEVKPVLVKGDRSKSALFDGSILAQKLDKLGTELKWEIMSKVWLELLCYAATNCRADSHAQQLSRGGELITVVWLLMAHFGLGDQFQISEGHARAKLIVGK